MHSFESLGIREELLQGISKLGFSTPTPVQEKVIPQLLTEPGDIVSLAQTGTGKTAAFGIPLIQLIRPKKKYPQALILCPTRELCIQVSKDLEALGHYCKGLTILSVYGGARIDHQIKSLKKGVHLLVATPGRLKDLLERKAVNLSNIRFVVFDEADEMLQMGFKDDLTAILDHTPKKKSTLLFSATMPREVAAIAKKYMHNPVEVTVGSKNSGSSNVQHELYVVDEKNRYLALKRIVDFNPGIYSIVFCRTRRECNDVASKLIHDGYNADALHGELSQGQRDQVMGKFRCRTLQILVATDVAARGLDVSDLSHVINYNLPDEIASYTHRSGRTGRAGRTGTSIVIVSPRDRYRVKSIERKLKRTFNQCDIPSGKDICEKQLLKLVDEVADVNVDDAELGPLYETAARNLLHLDREALIKHFISLQFNTFLEYYKDAGDLNIANSDQKQLLHGKDNKGFEKRPRPTGKFTTFRLNVGRRQGISPQGIIAKVNEIKNVGRIKLGQIDILRNSSRLEADSRYTKNILQAFHQTDINGKHVSIEVTQPESAGKKQFNKKRKFNKRAKPAKAKK